MYQSTDHQSKKKILNKAIGYALLIAGVGVLIITLIRGYVGYQDGLLKFTEAEFIAEIADVQSGFLPLVELKDLPTEPVLQATDEINDSTPDASTEAIEHVGTETVVVSKDTDTMSLPLF